MANPEESELHYPLGEALPPPGHSLEVAPGVRWVRMQLPFALDHINLWLLADRDAEGRPGWAVVDCGIADDRTRTQWEQVFASDPLQGLPVLRVFVTHMHPDHIGLADWLTARWSRPGRECRLWISATDWNAARGASGGAGGASGGEDVARFFALHGLVDPDSLQRIRARVGYYPSLVPAVPPRFKRLMDGLHVAVGANTWRCVAGYGHAPEHIALHAGALGTDGVLISGDMVLPRISTNVSVYELEPESDPLGLYLASLAGLRALPPRTLVLPSHGRPFVGLHERIGQLEAHHAARLSETLQACAERPCSAADLLPVMFRRPLDLHQTTFALGEAVAHLHLLAARGQVVTEDSPDGVRRWRAA